ncbi:MAG TPA: DegT/DnrJ/EryC1/StrS family aminotransferase [Caldimonas sp.]|nr:DegT/DnrJ/EryC1/StrS family aminotransferase [Caldimonas sp.]
MTTDAMGSPPMQALRYTIFDPTACGFPRPRVPPLPGLSLDALGRTAPATHAVLGSGMPQRHYRRGRYALHAAYRASGAQDGEILLAPAYHCRSILDPGISLRANLQLYPVNQRLEPDLDALDDMVRHAAGPVRALLLTHYFGFAQDAQTLASWCERRGIVLIEDCCHAYIVPRSSARIGRHGRYVTASPYKFFPCEDGGVLIAPGGAELPEARPTTLRAELRSLAGALARGWSQRAHRAGRPDPAALSEEWAAVVSAPGTLGEQRRFDSTEPSSLYDAIEAERAGSIASRGLVALCDVDRAAQQRRANYRRWRDATRELARCRPLFDDLPEDCVPYVFPLLIDDPASQFHALKRLGVPIWRWDDLADSTCSVSQQYRHRLLQLPCHQSLTDREMDWMIGAVRCAATGRMPKADGGRKTA